LGFKLFVAIGQALLGGDGEMRARGLLSPGKSDLAGKEDADLMKEEELS
jgi:hypothetical protein